MLLIALAKMPYGYYTLMRLIVCGTFIIIFFQSLDLKNLFWIIISVTLAVLYNPILPFHLGKDVWVPINIISIVLMLVSFFLLKYKKT